MHFHIEKLGDLVYCSNLNNMSFYIVKCMVMHIKNMCILIFGRLAVSCQHDAALKTEMVGLTERIDMEIGRELCLCWGRKTFP